MKIDTEPFLIQILHIILGLANDRSVNFLDYLDECVSLLMSNEVTTINMSILAETFINDKGKEAKTATRPHKRLASIQIKINKNSKL